LLSEPESPLSLLHALRATSDAWYIPYEAAADGRRFCAVDVNPAILERDVLLVEAFECAYERSLIHAGPRLLSGSCIQCVDRGSIALEHLPDSSPFDIEG
jgi:hypothetical protein